MKSNKRILYDKFSKQIDNGKPKWQPIRMTDHIVCDGYNGDYVTTVFSHFHTDHAWNITRAITNSTILLTPITLDALQALTGLSARSNIKPLSYNRAYHTPYEEKIELIDANHIIGSAQILVTENETGYRTLYSGDFSFPGIQTPKTDCLIIDPTHGSPLFDFETRRTDVLKQLFEDVIFSIENNRSVEIVAHRGIMQEIANYLEKTFDDKFIPEKVPFITSIKEKRLTDALRKYLEVPDNPHEMLVESDDYLNELYTKKQPYVFFSRLGGPSKQIDRHDVFRVESYTGFKKNGSYFKEQDGNTHVNFSSHSGYSDILKYVKETNAEEIIVDGSRGTLETCLTLSNAISKELGKICRVEIYEDK